MKTNKIAAVFAAAIIGFSVEAKVSSAAEAKMSQYEQFEQAREAYYKNDFPTFFRLSQPLAEAGYIKAQLEVANMYKYGIGVKKDTAKAKQLYETIVKNTKIAAEQGDAKAQFYLGEFYSKGLVVAKDKEQAKLWAEKSKANILKLAEQGDIDAQLMMGHLSGDFDERIKWYEKAALKGGITAQLALARTYDWKAGWDKNYSQAFALYKLLALRDLHTAQLQVARYYANGEGVSKDKQLADKWASKSINNLQPVAESGIAPAQFSLGIAYFSYMDMRLDTEMAAFEKKRKLGEQWLQKAADQGYPKAQLHLGMKYLNGIELPKDKKKGNKYLKMACEQGEDIACDYYRP